MSDDKNLKGVDKNSPLGKNATDLSIICIDVYSEL